MERPTLGEFNDPVEYFQHMLEYRRSTEPNFSVLRASYGLRKVSPSLVSLILRGKRRITLDRAEELAQLLGLTGAEKYFFKNWIESQEGLRSDGAMGGSDKKSGAAEFAGQVHSRRRKRIEGNHLLSDWVNVYVKDLFQLPEIQAAPEQIFAVLGSLVSRQRLERSFKFLLKEGYLRKRENGKIVIDNPLEVPGSPVPSQRIRRFHKQALNIAQSSLELYPPSERLANTLTLTLSAERYQEALGLIGDFVENLKEFADRDSEDSQAGERLYQLIINLSPVGGNYP